MQQMEDWKMCCTVMPCWETEGTKLKKLTLVPVELPIDGLKADWGLPRFSKDERIFEMLNELCPPYGVTVEMNEDGTIECKW